MESHNLIVLTDGEGWSKEIPLLKPLLYVGSHPSSDVILEASRAPGVAPRHLQLIALPGEQQGYRVANLSDVPVVLSSLPSPLAPRAVGIVGDGDSVRLGAFTLQFRIGAAGRAVPPSPGAGPRPTTQRPPGQAQTAPGGDEEIGLELRLSSLELGPDRPIEGIIRLHNRGDKPGVQFRVEVRGLPAECCELEPSPILFPGAEREIALRLHHPRGPSPVAGEHTLVIRASAPDAYPGQSQQVAQGFRLLPYYSHALRFSGVQPQSRRGE